MNKLISIAMLGLTSLALGGCAVQTGDERTAGKLGETNEAFSGNWGYSWGDTKQSDAVIGTSVGRTCFLTGIGGNFRPGGTIWDGPNAYNPAWGGVRINPTTKNYEIFVNPNPGESIIVQARCVNSAANRVTGEWSGGADVKLGAYTPNRHCFLTAIGNVAVNSTYTSNWAFTNTTDNVYVQHDGTSWYVGGNVTASGGWAIAQAVCVDATSSEGSYNGALAASPGSTTTALTNVAGSTCGLTKIRGSLEAGFGDWNDQLAISVPAGGSQFSLTAKNHKAGSASCMK